MKIQAELSLYPLKTDFLDDAVRNFIQELSKSSISVVPGRMSTVVAGQNEEVFRVIEESFAKACRRDELVLVVKFSNACPEKSGEERGRHDGVHKRRLGGEHNQSTKKSHERAVKIDESKCTGCGLCIQACPVEAITIDRVAKINADTCIDCGSCVGECPNEAISMEGMETASSSRGYALPPSHIPATPAVTSPTPSGVFGNQSVFQQVHRSGGLLRQIFDLLMSSGGQGGGRGRHHGGRRGRGNRRRFPIS